MFLRIHYCVIEHNFWPCLLNISLNRETTNWSMIFYFQTEKWERQSDFLYYALILLPVLSNHLLLSVVAGNHRSPHEELYVALFSIQKCFPIVGSCRIPQVCSIAIQNNVTQSGVASCWFSYYCVIYFSLSYSPIISVSLAIADVCVEVYYGLQNKWE